MPLHTKNFYLLLSIFTDRQLLYISTSIFAAKNAKKQEICSKFQQISANFMLFLMFFAQKMLKMTISISVWCAQHPNAGRNIQQTIKDHRVCNPLFGYHGLFG